MQRAAGDQGGRGRRKREPGDYILSALLGLMLLVGLGPPLFLILSFIWAVAHGVSLPAFDGPGG